MKNSKRIAIMIAVIMITVGSITSVCAMAAIGFDFTKMNTVSFETNTYAVDDGFTSISVNGAECDIKLRPSGDGSCKVVCHESDKISHTVSVENNELIVERHDNRRWYEYIGAYWGSMEVVIYIPQGEYEELYALNLSGDIDIPEGYTFGSAEIQSTSGNINFKADVSGELSIQTTSGDIYIGEITSENLAAASTSGNLTIKNVTAQNAIGIQTVSGDVEVSGVRCKNIAADTSSGDLEFRDVIMTDDMYVESVSGDVDLYRCDADSLWINTSSGDVSGTLLTEKIFLTDTSSGDIDVPRSTSGGKCEITTVSGDIEFDIE